MKQWSLCVKVNSQSSQFAVTDIRINKLYASDDLDEDKCVPCDVFLSIRAYLSNECFKILVKLVECIRTSESLKNKLWLKKIESYNHLQPRIRIWTILVLVFRQKVQRLIQHHKVVVRHQMNALPKWNEIFLKSEATRSNKMNYEKRLLQSVS